MEEYMAVTLYRMRSGKVHSFNRMAYGIENTSLMPATPAADGSKRRYLFSEEGVGIYPVLIRGDSSKEIVAWLAQAKGVRFTIKGREIVEDEDDFDAMLTRELEEKTGAYSYKATNTMEGFTICCKWHMHRTTSKAIEIHDGGMDAFKSMALFTGGMLGGGISNLVSPASSGVPSNAKVGIEVTKGLVGSAPDVYDIGSTLKGGGGGKSDVGFMVSYLPLKGGTNTGKSSIAARSLARIADRIWPG
jgi:hypothetical protein